MADNTINSPLVQVLGNTSGQQKIGMIFAVGTVVAMLYGMWMWGSTPDYRVLYSNVTDRDGGAIIDALQQMNVPYKFADGGGALLVPADKVHEMRLRLAAQGLPKGGTAGFELMENQKFGTSQFLEQVNYQRALEGELARSVQTLAAVQSARVHLAIPKATVFVKDQQKPSASVVLALYAGRSLNDEQVSSIIHLISSSVPDMPAKNVTVVDQSGALLSAPAENSTGPMDANQIDYVHKLEQDYRQRIENIIAPLLGAENVHAQVTASIDFTQTEQTSETYSPNQPPNKAALRSQQTEESLSKSSEAAAGVPGALSNQPPVPATAPITSPSVAAATSGGNNSSSTHKESTQNYEVDRTISYSKLPSGSIRRLSVAVVVNNRSVTDKKGKVSSVPLSKEEQEQISALVKDAIGFNDKRGDTLSVLNSAFDNRVEVLPEIPWWKNPDNIHFAKETLKYFLITGLGLLLLFKIIRPAFNSASKSVQEAAANLQISHPPPSAQPAGNFNNNLSTARQMAQQEPKVVASVIKEWVSGNE